MRKSEAAVDVAAACIESCEREKFAWIGMAIVKLLSGGYGVGPSVVAVLSYIATASDGKEFSMPIRKMASDTGISFLTIQKTISSLVETGMLVSSGEKRKAQDVALSRGSVVYTLARI